MQRRRDLEHQLHRVKDVVKVVLVRDKLAFQAARRMGVVRAHGRRQRGLTEQEHPHRVEAEVDEAQQREDVRRRDHALQQRREQRNLKGGDPEVDSLRPNDLDLPIDHTTSPHRLAGCGRTLRDAAELPFCR